MIFPLLLIFSLAMLGEFMPRWVFYSLMSAGYTWLTVLVWGAPGWVS